MEQRCARARSIPRRGHIEDPIASGVTNRCPIFCTQVANESVVANRFDLPVPERVLAARAPFRQQAHALRLTHATVRNARRVREERSNGLSETGHVSECRITDT